jgi:hypothetical protein
MKLRIWNGTAMKAQIQFEPRDLWVGLFWRQTDLCWHFYLCLVPVLPLHVTILKRFMRADFKGEKRWDRIVQ